MCPCFGTFSGKGDVGPSDRARDVCWEMDINVRSDDGPDLARAFLRVSNFLPHFLSFLACFSLTRVESRRRVSPLPLA